MYVIARVFSLFITFAVENEIRYDFLTAEIEEVYSLIQKCT